MAVLLAGLSLPAFAGDWGLDQETGAAVQYQTVQADGYWGNQQTSTGLEWTLGFDWDRTYVLRGGLVARAVQTSTVYQNTVYPGYQGWGWTLGADWFPLRTGWEGASWAAGLSLGGTYEYLTYPGLYKSFVLPGLSFGLASEVDPGTLFGLDTRGLSLRLRVPVGVDHRDGFRLSWRVGAEVSLVFRGVGGQTP
jgi:hypothetical protein